MWGFLFHKSGYHPAVNTATKYIIIPIYMWHEQVWGFYTYRPIG